MAPVAEFSIRIEDQNWSDAIESLEDFTTEVLAVVVPVTRAGEVDILLASDDDIQALNAQWRGNDKPTDVLSFPSTFPDENMLGDIALGFGVVSSDAEKMGKSIKSHYAHMLVHGYLHLVGYDHQTDQEAEKMERLERQILADLGFDDPYSVSEMTNG